MFKFAVVVVGLCSGWAGIVVDVAMMWCASATQSGHSGGGRFGCDQCGCVRFFETGSSSKLGETPSHFTRKCKMSVVHAVMAAGVFFFLRFSYQFSASKSDLQRL